ncbi:glycosyltransferase-like protein [Selaginella moellendorffii]|uniref:Hexosyltransferase n=1 Tax=Selaginella moellendorffii TaxID=88036 RepID=D8R6M6_SELML|nr:glycosyltransferase-like protein [Selaginella moellendorffii]
MPSSPGKKLPALRFQIYRARAVCLRSGAGIFAAFVLGVLLTLLVAPGRFGWGPAPCHQVEDTFRSSEAWRPGVLQEPLESRPKVLGVVGIQTGFGSRERRKALRETWMPDSPEGLVSLQQSTGLAIRFIIGHTADKRKMEELEEEIETYKDFIRIDIEEEYLKLTHKTLAYFKAAYMLFDAEFYVKADDDIYLRTDRLATLLAKDRSTPRTYLGCMKKGPVITDSRQKWYEPLAYLLGSEYFLHAYGPIYALSSEVVAALAIARNDSFRMFTNEDVTLGSWMLAMNVNHEDNRALCEQTCTPTSIAVWDIPKCSGQCKFLQALFENDFTLTTFLLDTTGLCNPEQRLREVHQLDACSRSPTLPD